MRSQNQIRLMGLLRLLGFTLLLVPSLSQAQTVVATIPIGTTSAFGLAVNPVTNKVYVASCLPNLKGGPPTGGLTIIDGATNATTVINGCFGGPLVVNSATNKVYFGAGVIDGATNSVTYIPGVGGNVVAVNPVTNKIYVASEGLGGGGGYTYVIDGATNSVTTVFDPNAQPLFPAAIAVNPVTNKIYVANNSLLVPLSTNPGNITVIDGGTNTTTTITDPNAFSPMAVAVNSVTNKIYVANVGDFSLNPYLTPPNPPGSTNGNITVIDGASNATTTLTDPNIFGPQTVAVNESTNKIYVTELFNGTSAITVIDGATNELSFVSDPNGESPHAVAVDSLTNTIYVTNPGCLTGCSNLGSVTVINGATNAVTTVIDPNATHPWFLAINPTTNKIYVENGSSLSAINVTVIDGGATPTSHTLLVALAGNGSGSVTSNPAGVNCGTSCAASFPTGTGVTLTASSAGGSTFSGWTAPCAGTAACSVPMTSDMFVAAVFDASPPPDFSIQPLSANLTVQRGSHATDVIFIVPSTNSSFGDAIQFSCTVIGPPPMPTCALSPSTVITGGSQEGSSTLTITAPGTTAALTPPVQGWRWDSLYAAVLPLTGLVLIGFCMTAGDMKPWRRKLWLLCSLFIMFVALQAGCGGGNSNPQPPPSTQPQSYTVTVTATAGTLQHTTQVTVTVQ